MQFLGNGKVVMLVGERGMLVKSEFFAMRLYTIVCKCRMNRIVDCLISQIHNYEVGLFASLIETDG